MSKKVTITIDMGDAAFDDTPDMAAEYVLEQVKGMMIGTKSPGKLYDYNGNHVGNVETK